MSTVVKRFSASWCGPCRQLAPIMESVAQSMPDVVFQTIDVDENQPAAQQYGVRSVPTVVIEVNGHEVTRFSGMRPQSSIVQIINEAK